MVYCGKASQGCQSCRTRRIKCDKLRPDCSQCVRVSKKCPGYRDQLSLMFRDESSKVIQKAHAQWGVDDVPEASGSTLTEPTSSKPPASTLPHDQISAASTLPSPPSSHAGFSTDLAPYLHGGVHPSIGESYEDQGFRFYINRYLIGHPDEPRTAAELSMGGWHWDPALRDIFTAVGLAGLSNLKGDLELMSTARRQYGSALRTAGQLIQSKQQPSVDVTSRLVVLLALFELVKGTELSAGTVYAHVAGGAALIRSWFPMQQAQCGGVRPLLQLCYSTFITAYETGMDLPAMFLDWVTFARQAMTPEDEPAAELGLLVAQFVELSSCIRFRSPSLQGAARKDALQKLERLDSRLATWEESLDGQWLFSTENGNHFHPAAIFRGEYHRYSDMWIAAMWNYYRWARVLVNQAIFEIINGSPSIATSSKVPGAPSPLQIIQRLSKDLFASTPSHWRHPLLGEKGNLSVRQIQPGGGAGSAAIPILLFHLKGAACAPGVSIEDLDWTYAIMECIWGDMGMLNAKGTMNELMMHRDRLQNLNPASASSSTG
ncbi:hypothetical protein V2G26_015850 [Clonostachys chloroleuca]